MPCDTVTIVAINAGKMNPDILAAGLRAEGKQVVVKDGIVYWDGHQYNSKTGQLQFQNTSNAGVDEFTAQVKQTYAASIVTQAKKAGWQVTQTAKNKFQLTKRTI